MLYELWMTKSSVVAQQAYDQMTDQEKTDFEGKLREAHNAANVTVLVDGQCGWASERYQHWGLNLLPSLDARLTLYNKMQESGLFKYIEGMTVLGSSDQQHSWPSFFPPVYLVWMLRADPGAILERKKLAPDELNRLLESERAAFEKHGGCQILSCDSYWANADYTAFGIEAFPSLEELQAYKSDLYQLDWARYFPGESVVGLPSEYPPTGQGG